jgi:hypothetical protein
MDAYKFSNEDEQLFESSVYLEVTLLHFWIFKRNLELSPSILFAKFNSKTLLEMSKFYAIEISGSATRENKNFVYTKGEGVKCNNIDDVDVSMVNEVVMFDDGDINIG